MRVAREVALLATLIVCTGTGEAHASDPFVDCRRRFAEKPLDYESSACFQQTMIRDQLWAEGARVFEALIREHPENYWLPLSFGHVFRERDPDRSIALYRAAAEGFRKTGHAGGEIVARSNLRNFLYPKGRIAEAIAEMDRVAALEPSTADSLLKAQIWMLRAAHVQDTGGDHGLAYRLLKQAQRAIFPDGSYRLKRTCLSALGIITFRMGRADEALAIYDELERLSGAAGDVREQAAARYNIFNVSAMQESLVPGPDARQRLLRLARLSLESALSARHTSVTLKSHGAMAALLSADSRMRGEALDHVRQCLTLAAAIRQPQDELICSWIEASLLRESDRQLSEAAAVRAVAAAARVRSPLAQAFSAGQHMKRSWQTKSRPDAIRDSLAAIDAIETLRSLQDDAGSSAELFSTWTLQYYWLSGRLLSERERDLDLAFSVTERLRARSLLDQLDRRNRLPSTHSAVVGHRSVLESIAAVQRRLMDPRIGVDVRRATLAELEALEHREQEARRQIALAAGSKSRAAPTFASLDAVQAALADDEALLSFQVGIWDTYEGEFGGGSWLIAVTRHGRSVYRIPDRGALAPMVPVFTGLLASRDDVGTPAAVRLYNDLLGDALRELPAGIRRLILVPDGPLHRLPFEALRPGHDAPPLAARYAVMSVPSATLWLHWLGNAPRAAGRRALALADPDIAGAGARASTERNAVLQQGLRLGPLPHARRESRALEHHLGAVDALVGDRASERALKDRSLHDYQIVHLAAHAIADEKHPERSAVLLSPGADGEDGLLQTREIASLDLQGRIVVLSACQTASGAVLSGEGVLSLARAFFEAGAQAVVGTRWPIRDEDAAALFDTFYRALATGASLSEALARAQVEAIAAERPAAAWASLVVLGNGGLRPFPGGLPQSSAPQWQMWLLATGSMLLIAWAASRARTALREWHLLDRW
jgi:CHAT domain-containing protein/tetratricopeptide (TPR) repeat protein